VHILLTDILTCPRCGPEFGLILLADRITERRVQEGTLGCANCRTQYPIRNGALYMDATPAALTGVASPDAAVRIAALTGLTHGSRYAIMAGPAAQHAPAVAALIDGLEVIAIAEARAGAPPAEEENGVNPLGVTGVLPFTNARVTGVALTGAMADALLEEGARVLSPVGRLLLDPAPADAEERLRAAGLRVLARDATTVVAGHQ
jgi:uncharacterized protein YbaR (Trm112 family)